LPGQSPRYLERDIGPGFLIVLIANGVNTIFILMTRRESILGGSAPASLRATVINMNIGFTPLPSE
jgi:hypothetical protein